MSGHSKWSTIKRQKGVADAKRGQVFTKIANAITIAARLGGAGDPNLNPRLRVALEAARKVNMPKENIMRAIDRGLGKLPGQALEEITYEGFGPGKVAFFLEGVTDNRQRISQEIKNLFEKGGGALGGQGSTAYMFEKKGEIRIRSKREEKEKEMLELIDLGAEDVDDYQEGGEQKYLVYTESSDLNNIGNKIVQLGFTIESSEIVLKPNVTIKISESGIAKKVLELAEKFEEQ